jgi:hypothetical protein
MSATPTNSPVILPVFTPEEQSRVDQFLQLYNQASPIVKYHMLNLLCHINIVNFTQANKITPPSYKDILMNQQVVVASEVVNSPPPKAIKLLKRPPSNTKKSGKITQSAYQEVSNFNQAMTDAGY